MWRASCSLAESEAEDVSGAYTSVIDDAKTLLLALTGEQLVLGALGEGEGAPVFSHIVCLVLSWQNDRFKKTFKGSCYKSYVLQL